MTAKKAAAPPPLPKVRRGEGDVLEYPLYEFVALFADGDTATVIATHDDSNLRELLVKEHGPDARIAGVSFGRHVGWVRADWP